MRVSVWVPLLVLGLAIAAPASAGKLYKWVDEKGNVHFSDKVPPEAAMLAHKNWPPKPRRRSRTRKHARSPRRRRRPTGR